MRIEDDVGYYMHNGQQIIVVKQGSGESISLFSAKKDGSVTGYSTQLIQDIKDSRYDITAKINCNYFGMNSGMALGVRCGVDEWSVPRQGAWYYYALLKNGRTEIGMDYDFWYTSNDVVFACSPALILMKDGQHVHYKSPAAENSKDHLARQSLLIRTRKCFAFVASVGLLSIAELKNWCMQIEDIQDIIVLDGGGSVCLEDDGKLLVKTDRKDANFLCFYKPKQVEKSKDEEIPMDKEKAAQNTLKGIDISNWQAGLNLSAIDFDFVIVKATQGTSFVDRYCDGFFQKAKSMGKLLGFYHYGIPKNDPVVEARFFYDHTKNYFGKAIPVLDIEEHDINVVDWCYKFLSEIIRLSGIKPMIYMSEQSFNWKYDWTPVVNLDCGLWVAKYRDADPDYNYDMSFAGTPPKVKWWSGYAMWQWTSTGRLNGYDGNLDCDIFYGDRNAWMAYATSKAVVPDDPPESDDLMAELEALRSENAELKAENKSFEETIIEYKKRVETAEKALRGEL